MTKTIDLRIGLKGEYPPQVTVSGGAIIPGADFVNLHGEYYARLDSPHHPETNRFAAELNALLEPPTPKTKTKVSSDESSETP